MLYTFGDSASNEWSLIKNGHDELLSKTSTWPMLLSKRLNQPLTDFSYPGSSNWRIARLIQNLELTSDDVVVIQWTSPYKFEFGVNDRYDYKSTIKEKEYFNPDFEKFDSIDNENGIRVKMMCPSLLYRTSDGPQRDFMKIAYRELRNDAWYEQMNQIMIASCIHYLQKSKCKFIMVDGYTKQCKDNVFKDVPQYFLRGGTMVNHIRGRSGNEFKDKTHLSINEHEIACDILVQNLKEIYD